MSEPKEKARVLHLEQVPFSGIGQPMWLDSPLLPARVIAHSYPSTISNSSGKEKMVGRRPLPIEIFSKIPCPRRSTKRR